MHRKRSFFTNTLILIMLVTIGCLFSACVERTAVNKALAAGDIEKAKTLIEEGAEINARLLYLDPQFPLHYALMYGQPEIARLLIEKGADINVQNDLGLTPLHYALMMVEPEIARLLIEKGADINVRDGWGETPLHRAFISNIGSFPAKGAKIYERTPNSWFPQYFNTSATQPETARLLIEKEADLNVQDNFGMTPLHYAVMKNNLELGSLMIEKGADNSEDVDPDSCRNANMRGSN